MDFASAFYQPSEDTRLVPATGDTVAPGQLVAHYNTGRLAIVKYVSAAKDKMVCDLAYAGEQDKGGEQWRWVTAYNLVLYAAVSGPDYNVWRHVITHGWTDRFRPY